MSRGGAIPAGLAALALGACGGGTPRPAPPDAAAAASPFRAAQAAEAERLGLPASFEGALGLRFELVPTTEFRMGSPRDAPGRSADEVPHTVRQFASYYVGVEEVPVRAVAAWKGEAPPAGGEGRPATGLTHARAVAFAQWLSSKDEAHAYRLPTESEWECAARTAGEVLRGLSDGPWEWCSDRYGPYPDWFVMNPTGPAEGDERVLRGGPGASAARRGHDRPEAVRADVGLRLVAPLPYGKAGVGAATLDFHSFVADDQGEPVESDERPGFEVRIITVLDRLSARQQALDLPWQTIPRLRTPFAWRLPPGRYYAQCQVPGTDTERGVEIKIDADRPEVRVRLPVPRGGVTLAKPQ